MTGQKPKKRPRPEDGKMLYAGWVAEACFGEARGDSRPTERH